jgi:cytokinin dehydrogenase
MYGQSQVRDGVVVDNMTPLNKIVAIGSDCVSVEADLTWRYLLRACLQHGVIPPVLTDLLSRSIGGTLSVGGVSGTSFRYGAPVDNILDLDVVTGKAI